MGHPPASRRRVSGGPLTVEGLLLAAAGREWVKMRPNIGPSSFPPLDTSAHSQRRLQSPARLWAWHPSPARPLSLAPHHRSSSRLSSCRLPDCTPWAPRPPPPPDSGSSSSSCCCCCCPRGSAESEGLRRRWGWGWRSRGKAQAGGRRGGDAGKARIARPRGLQH